MYFVTVTPVMLNVAIENIPRMQKNNNPPFEKAYEKYANGLSRNGSPQYVNTHAYTPNVQGIKVMIGNKTKYPHNPNNPSYPTTYKGFK